MKKTLIVILVIAAAFAVVAPAYAAPDAGKGPGFGGMGVNGQSGSMEVYMEQAMASVLGIDADEFEARHDAGETFYAIALDAGFSADELPALFASAREQAFALAAEDGVTVAPMGGYGQFGGTPAMQPGTGYGANGSPQFDPENCPMNGTGAAAGGFRGGR